jgi:hypothetical protein
MKKSKMPYVLTGLAIFAELIVIAVCVMLAILIPKDETGLRLILTVFIIWHIVFDPTGILKMFTPKKIKENFNLLLQRFGNA